jgi:hypothetical protein
MSQIYQPKPDNRKYFDLIQHIKNGAIKIPKFQREFVWEKQKTADLLDSILKGYPIGTIIIWKTKERLRSIKNLGNVDLPDTPDGDSVQYILDGQQRLASLFVVREGLSLKKDNKDIDYKTIYINLDKDSTDPENIVTIEKPDGTSITVHQLLNEGAAFIADNYPRDYLDLIDHYKKRFETYDFSTIVISDYPIDQAVEIFNRINTTGKALTLFEIMVAKTFDETTDFDLRDKYEELEEDLENISYKIPTAQLLQCISLNLTQECTRKIILSLDKKKIIDIWNETIIAIKSAVDYFKKDYRIPVSRLLPYDALIVPFAFFFFKNKKNPNPDQSKFLEEYFWKTALTNRFTSAVETKLGQDAKKINKIIKNLSPSYGPEFKVTLTKDEIIDYPFSTGESISKSILCVFSSLRPQSFSNNTEVILDNSYLIQGNSKNYHHFFPKAYLKKKNIEKWQRNVIGNITLVDDYLNKREIGAKPPSKYMEEFKKINPKLKQAMKTHLINDLDDCGIWDDNYEKFLEKRSELIWKELKKRFEP